MTNYEKLHEVIIQHPWIKRVEPHLQDGEAYLKFTMIDNTDIEDRDYLIYEAEALGSSTLIPSDNEQEFIFKFN